MITITRPRVVHCSRSSRHLGNLIPLVFARVPADAEGIQDAQVVYHGLGRQSLYEGMFGVMTY